MSKERLSTRFKFSPPSPHKATAHASIRHSCLEAAAVIETLVPDGRERSLAITKLEEVMFWANAGIARETVSDSEQSAPDAPQQSRE